MKIVKAGYQILKPDMDDPAAIKAIYQSIEESGRTCYKSDAAMTDETGEKFVRTLIKNGHNAMLEHAFMKVRFTVDRGISHELVRHRLAAFAQESTRYCNYSKDKFGNEITVIEPCFFDEVPYETKQGVAEYFASQALEPIDMSLLNTPKDHQYFNWYGACCGAEDSYFQMLEWGATPEEARSVLPTSLKTEIVITANMREWRHVFKLRAAGETGKPHPQMLEVMVPLLNECKLKMPALFGDISAKED